MNHQTFTRQQLIEISNQPMGHFELRMLAGFIIPERQWPDSLRLNGTTDQVIQFILDNQ